MEPGPITHMRKKVYFCHRNSSCPAHTDLTENLSSIAQRNIMPIELDAINYIRTIEISLTMSYDIYEDSLLIDVTLNTCKDKCELGGF